jgi:hypothetical protein
VSRPKLTIGHCAGFVARRGGHLNSFRVSTSIDQPGLRCFLPHRLGRKEGKAGPEVHPRDKCGFRRLELVRFVFHGGPSRSIGGRS